MTDVAVPGEPVRAARRIELDVTGMSCAMCAARIHNRLNKIDGVRASVSFDSGVATIVADGDVSVAGLCEAVRRAGYGAEPRSVLTVGSGDPGARLAEGPLRRLVMLVLGWLSFRW